MTKNMVQPPNDRNKEGQGSYASVNGLAMYYEIHGTGNPLVLLGGGFMTIYETLGIQKVEIEKRQVWQSYLAGRSRAMTGISRGAFF